MGLELLEQEDEEKLNEIQCSNQGNASEGCKQMFQLWLQKCADATWNHLIQALQEIGLKQLANKVHLMLRRTEGRYCIYAFIAMLDLWNIALLGS